jgi:predicted CxxxxCH...CXXCH cytochrome family protein
MRARQHSLVLSLLSASVLAAGCAKSSEGSSTSALGPAGATHQLHLQGGVVSTGMTCSDCHAASGFAVDFSQNPAVQAAGATFDPTTQTCSNVSCHGNFGFNGVLGTRAAVTWAQTAPLTCASCHAMPPAGHPALAAADARSCAACHADTVNGDGTINVASGAHMNGKADVTGGGSCSSCHGDPSRVPSMAGTDANLTSAPPLAPTGSPASTVGAHLAHLNPNPATAVAAPVACAACHVVPGDAAHATNPPAQRVAFGALATANGASPSWVTGSAGCAASYCHGSFSFNGVKGSSATPTWTDTTSVTCTSCHGMPPAGHPPVNGGGTAASCSGCHPQSVDGSGAIVAGGAHLNGKADVAAVGCTTCHGDATRVGSMPGADLNLASAPPVPPANAPAFATGAHLGHLNPSAATALMGPIACAECHVVPGDAAHATSPPAQKVVFGSLSRTGGAAPTWAAGSAGCAASYCHGNFTFNGVSGANATPIWTSTAALTCTSCHGMPPTGHAAVAAPVTAASCSACHPKAVNADGSMNLVDKGHLNGKADTSALGCSSCHGDASRKGNLAGTDVNLVSSPPVAPPNAPAYAVGAHLGHVNPTSSSFLMAPIACAECHPTFTDAAHATNPPAQKVVFGTLSRTGGAAPTWAAGSAGCAASYCHGNFSFNGVTGSNATPIWTTTTALTCTSCHGMPPTGHIAVAAPVTAASCAQCHPAAVNADGTINATAKGHLNGKADVTALACSTCHGDASRTANLAGTDGNLTAAPPAAPAGAPAYAVGAHVGHVNPTAGSYLMAPIACAECHPAFTDSAHATNPPANAVVFGALSRTGGAAPTWTAGTAGCAASYCHGNFSLNGVTGSSATPIWTSTAALTCTSCHGMPPTGHPAYTGTPTAASCFQCHPQSVNADGTIKQGGGHLNGKADGGGCTSCHGDPPSTGGHTRHRSYGCGECHTGYTSTSASGTLHQNGVVDLGPAQVGYFCNGRLSVVGCTPLPAPPAQPVGPYGTCTNSCHETHNNRGWNNGN